MNGWRVARYVFAVMSLLVSLAWLIFQPGFEPALVVLGALLALGDLLFNRGRQKPQQPTAPKSNLGQAVSDTLQFIRQWWSKILSGLKTPGGVLFPERIGIRAMRKFERIDHDVVTAVLLFTSLLALAALWAGVLALRGPELHLWAMIGLVWLGLVIFPAIAGSLPQQQENDIYAKLNPSSVQRRFLWLDKSLGTYACAFLGEAAAVLVWLLLWYAGLWQRLHWITQAVYWFVTVLLTCFLAFVGAVIAVRYFWNLTKEGSETEPTWQDYLLGLGFPLIIYPGLIFFALETIELWTRWQFGVPVISLMALALAWALRRDTRKSKLPKVEPPNAP